MTAETIRTYCSMCGVGCPAAVTVDGKQVLSLKADREHPLGGLMCPKGRAAPEIHDHPHRVNYPMRRTRPKTASDPGWQRCTWDEALDLIAAEFGRIRAESGPEAVVMGRGTASGTGLGPAEPWVSRLCEAFGSPNYMTNTHICNWARDGAVHYTFGQSLQPPPDVEHSGCVIVWGANPLATRISLATAITTARRRGLRLIVVDPRRTELGRRADLVLQVRPGTDVALALACIHLMLENRWYDESFVREWTNAPFLVREDTGRLLRTDEVEPGALGVAGPGHEPGYVAQDAATGRLVEYRPGQRRYAAPSATLELTEPVTVDLRDGPRVRCRPVLALLAEQARQCEPAVAARITGVPEEQIREAVRLVVENRPAAHFVWNGIVQHTNGTQAGRAIEIFYALIGDWDRRGANVVLPPRTTGRIADLGLIPTELAARRLGREERPLGPAAVHGQVVAPDVFSAILEDHPYRVRGLLTFGSNTLLNTGDPHRGRAALQALEFFAQVEQFHTPTSELADVLLPAATFLESDVLMITREGRAEPRRRVVEPMYERRPDIEIIFDLACRLGLGEWFADGSVTDAYDAVLVPAGLSWQALLEQPDGVSVLPDLEFEKHAAVTDDGTQRGFPTPSGRVELFVDRFAAHGQPPLPRYEEPAESPVRTPGLARDFPLVLTNAKRGYFLHSQHRGVASLRRHNPEPTVEIHPQTAAQFDIADGARVALETPKGGIRVRAKHTETIVPGVVCANHGWWEACEELGLDKLDPFSETGANVNLLVHNDARDPISGGVPHRSVLCRLRPLTD
ncbi:MAG TPA: molybdopterin-dependent oxidoreductase [Jatrophihabitans sp.]|jgi:anaerobic selenocysteine-containing dehydrogenase|nr:molybdopterin-dependent oxidoreductase [Jatrophihabitans sp.]